MEVFILHINSGFTVKEMLATLLRHVSARIIWLLTFDHDLLPSIWLITQKQSANTPNPKMYPEEERSKTNCEQSDEIRNKLSRHDRTNNGKWRVFDSLAGLSTWREELLTWLPPAVKEMLVNLRKRSDAVMMVEMLPCAQRDQRRTCTEAARPKTFR